MPAHTKPVEGVEMAKAVPGIRIVLLALVACGTTLLASQVMAAGKRPKVGEHLRECRNCPELIVLPAGNFTMGSPPAEPEREEDEPQRRVRIARPFAMAIAPVTWSQWEACVRDNWCEGAEVAGDDVAGRDVAGCGGGEAGEGVDDVVGDGDVAGH